MSPAVVIVGGLALVAVAGVILIKPELPASVTGGAIDSYPVSEWQHGYRTSRVIATRYKNPDIGYNIGFQFPEDTDNADRAEVSDFFTAHGCGIFQGGGYAGAEAFVKCEDVTDKDSANKKLQEILPPLSQLMADMAVGKTVKIDLPKPKYEWPDTDCKDSGSLSDGYHQYVVKEVAHDKCQWVENIEAEKAMAKKDAHRRALWQALRTRVVTDDEMKEILAYGDNINIESMQPYYPTDKDRERADAFVTQMKLRAAAGVVTKAP